MQDVEIDRHQRMTEGEHQGRDGGAYHQRRDPQQARTRQKAGETIAGAFGAAPQSPAQPRRQPRQQPVLLLDEPFSALDPALRQEMLTLVADICRQQQLTLLMVSHSVEDAARIAPRSVVVAEGRIAWDGETAALLNGSSSASALLGISAK